MDSAVKSDGTVWQLELDAKGDPKVKQVTGISDEISITSGSRNHYVLLNDGHVMSWGTNKFGQAGLGILDFKIKEPQMVKKSIAVFIDGEEIEVAMPLGAHVEWDATEYAVRIDKGGETIRDQLFFASVCCVYSYYQKEKPILNRKFTIQAVG